MGLKAQKMAAIFLRARKSARQVLGHWSSETQSAQLTAGLNRQEFSKEVELERRCNVLPKNTARFLVQFQGSQNNSIFLPLGELPLYCQTDG